jgi:hypothetical protein
MTAMVSTHLEPYRGRFIDQWHRELTEELLAWSLRLCSCRRGASWHARTAFLAATFEVHCAPADAALWESLLCGKYCTYFFIVDDAPREEVTDLADRLRTGRPAASSELGAVHRKLLDDFRAGGLSAPRLETEIAEFCSAVSTEGLHDVHTMTWEQFRALRRVTVGTHPYITCWRILRGLLDAERIAESEVLVDLAVEAAYLTNDLASLTKELHADEDGAYATSNWVRFHARSSNDLHEAVHAAVTRYNHIVETFRQAGHRQLVRLLSSFVDGNLSSYFHLTAARYPDAEETLHGLLRITHE